MKLPKTGGLIAIGESRFPPRTVRSACDWEERIPSREHIPLGTRMTRSIEVSSQLSKLPILGREAAGEVVRMIPEEIIPVLKHAKIDFVLAGAHGIGGWMAETRATQDVDFLIRVRDARAAAEAVMKTFPGLVLEKFPDVWRFRSGEQYVIDLMLTRAPLMKRIHKEFHEIASKGQKIKVPKLEAAMAMKFAAMVGHARNRLKKGQDALDFISMISANSKIDVRLLEELGELVYSGGGVQVVQYVEDVRAGRRLEI